MTTIESQVQELMRLATVFASTFERAAGGEPDGYNIARAALETALRSALAADVQRIVHLQASRERRIYIAGPMTGLPEFNFPLFNATAATLRAEGWHVENPAEHGHVKGATWVDYLRYDIGRLATCSAVYLLPDWTKSKGAKLEVRIARDLGMEFLGATIAEPAAAGLPELPPLDDPDEYGAMHDGVQTEYYEAGRVRAMMAAYGAACARAAVPDGFCVVPLEPTAKMLAAMVNITYHGSVPCPPGGRTSIDAVGLDAAWRAMIAAAPKPGDAG